MNWRLLGILAVLCARLTGGPEFTYSLAMGGFYAWTAVEFLEFTPGGGVAVDALGQAHVLLQPSLVVKVAADGSKALYSTWIQGVNRVWGIALDAQGNAYVTGESGGQNFPETNRLAQNPSPPEWGAFVAKLNPAGQIVYCIRLNSVASVRYPDNLPIEVQDAGTSIAVDRDGNAYVAGQVVGEIPVTAGAYQPQRRKTSVCTEYVPSLCSDAFVMKINPQGTSIVWSTYLGGTRQESANAIAVSAAGEVTVGGYTTSADFPATPGVLRPQFTSRHEEFGLPWPFSDGFVARLSADGRALRWSTFLGGGFEDLVQALALDALGNVYLGGYSSSPDFPLKDPLEQFVVTTTGAYGGGTHGFAAKLGPDGSQLRFSTFLGGALANRVFGVAVDASGSMYLAGHTPGSDFPTLNAPKAAFQEGRCKHPVSAGTVTVTCLNGFLTKIQLDPPRFVYSTYIGGSDYDAARALAVGPDGAAYVSGYVLSKDFPIKGDYPLRQPNNFLVKMPPVPNWPAHAVFPEFSKTSVVNAASFEPGIVRGGIVSIFGKNLSGVTGVVQPPGFPLPAELAGVSVTFNGHQGRILAVANVDGVEQINVQVPWEVPNRSLWTTVAVSNGQATKLVFNDLNRFTQGAIFMLGEDQPAMFHADFSLVSAESPAIPGEVLLAYGTGLSDVSPIVPVGQAAPAEPLSWKALPRFAVVNGRSVTAQFSGLAPGLAGVYQVNFPLPDDTPSGTATVGLSTTAAVTIYVR